MLCGQLQSQLLVCGPQLHASTRAGAHSASTTRSGSARLTSVVFPAGPQRMPSVPPKGYMQKYCPITCSPRKNTGQEPVPAPLAPIIAVMRPGKHCPDTWQRTCLLPATDGTLKHRSRKVIWSDPLRPLCNGPPSPSSIKPVTGCQLLQSYLCQRAIHKLYCEQVSIFPRLCDPVHRAQAPPQNQKICSPRLWGPARDGSCGELLEGWRGCGSVTHMWTCDRLRQTNWVTVLTLADVTCNTRACMARPQGL